MGPGLSLSTWDVQEGSGTPVQGLGCVLPWGQGRGTAPLSARGIGQQQGHDLGSPLALLENQKSLKKIPCENTNPFLAPTGTQGSLVGAVSV